MRKSNIYDDLLTFQFAKSQLLGKNGILQPYVIDEILLNKDFTEVYNTLNMINANYPILETEEFKKYLFNECKKQVIRQFKNGYSITKKVLDLYESRQLLYK